MLFVWIQIKRSQWKAWISAKTKESFGDKTVCDVCTGRAVSVGQKLLQRNKRLSWPARIADAGVCLLSSTVSFLDCGGGEVWFQVEDKHDFSVNEDGGVYALHHLNLLGKEKAVLVYAHDLHTKQVWKARIHLRVHPSNSTQTEVKAFKGLLKTLQFSCFWCSHICLIFW